MRKQLYVFQCWEILPQLKSTQLAESANICASINIFKDSFFLSHPSFWSCRPNHFNAERESRRFLAYVFKLLLIKINWPALYLMTRSLSNNATSLSAPRAANEKTTDGCVLDKMKETIIIICRRYRISLPIHLPAVRNTSSNSTCSQEILNVFSQEIRSFLLEASIRSQETAV